MTNTQQSIVESETDQPLEEIQLTELKPVQQSWIKESINDGNVTDGLKALRNFSQQQVNEFETFAANYPKRRKGERWKPTENSNEFENNSNDGECIKKIKTIQNCRKGQTTKFVSRVLNDDFEQDDEKFYGINGDFDYLEGKNDSEIYVYRQRDSCISPEIGPRAKKLDKEQKDQDCNRGRTYKVQTKPVVSGRPRGRPRKKFPKKKKKKKADFLSKTKESNKPSIISTDDSEKELQSKINDIIQANYLLEQVNNNIIDNDYSKIHEDMPDSSERCDDPLKKYCCDLCQARFKGSGGLRNHYKVVHTTGPLFRCNECGKEFPLKERLKLHVRTHTGFKPYKCPECDKSFARGGQLVQHRRTHSQIKPYSCHLCSGTFTCAANLALHVKRHNGQKDHKCDICGRGFVRRDALKKHLECLHRDVKSFLCGICNKTFKGHLPQHMRTHAQDRPHGCATCGQRFAQKSQLTVHQRTHSGQRPFRCLVCWQAFAHSTALKLHTRRHTGERPFKCAECNAGFTQLPHWKKHMKCIHGRSEPYCCRKCNSFFRIKNDLEAHEKDCQSESNNDSTSSDPGSSVDGQDAMSIHAMAGYRNMSIEKMRLLLAVLLKRISKQEKLDELGFGKRLIDEVLTDSLISAGKEVVKPNEATLEIEALRKNLTVFLEWTVPKEHWDNFRKMKKSPEEVLETLTAT